MALYSDSMKREPKFSRILGFASKVNVPVSEHEPISSYTKPISIYTKTYYY